LGHGRISTNTPRVARVRSTEPRMFQHAATRHAASQRIPLAGVRAATGAGRGVCGSSSRAHRHIRYSGIQAVSGPLRTEAVGAQAPRLGGFGASWPLGTISVRPSRPRPTCPRCHSGRASGWAVGLHAYRPGARSSPGVRSVVQWRAARDGGCAGGGTSGGASGGFSTPMARGSTDQDRAVSTPGPCRGEAWQSGQSAATIDYSDRVTRTRVPHGRPNSSRR